MSTNLSRSPIQIYDVSVTSLNEAFRRITEEIDQLQGLRGNQNPIADLNISGTMQSGSVPIPRLIRLEKQVTLTAGGGGFPITLISGGTTISSLDLGIVNTGERIYCEFIADITKSGAAGISSLSVSPDSSSTAVVYTCGGNSGTSIGLIEWYESSASLLRKDHIVNYKVTTPGQLKLNFTGVSQTSNSTINFRAAFYAAVLNG